MNPWHALYPRRSRPRGKAIGYFLKRYREDMVRNKNKAQTIEGQLREFEARLRKQLLREKLDGMSSAFETGAMPQIHASIGQLAASKPATPERELVSGD